MRGSRRSRRFAGALACFGLGLALPLDARAAAPPASDEDPDSPQVRVSGRVREAGTRAPVAGVKVMLVAAPPGVRPGRRAREPLDPAQVTWIREAISDDAGRFEIPVVPAGKIRVVIVAEGYARLEQWAEAGADAGELELFLRSQGQAAFRTEVLSERESGQAEAEHQVEGQRARVYPGSGGDPVRAAQNLPGVARAPGGLGLMAIRGGDPRQTGLYVDGHPVPRAFHVLPISAVVDPSMVDRVELTPGNFDAAYGGFGGGLLHIRTRDLSGVAGIHGEGHVDLFDVGAAIRAPVGPGGVGFAFRRAHVGDVVKAADSVIGNTGILVPNYWDYIGRFDLPIGRRHRVSVKAFGAGDGLQDSTEFEPGETVELDFRATFHRFDLGYAYEGPRLSASISGALLLEDSRQTDSFSTSTRNARSPSLRGSLALRLSRRATLLAGADFVHTRALRQNHYTSIDDSEYESKYWRLGTWLGAAFVTKTRVGRVLIRPQVRLNVFASSTEARVRPDPRLDLRADVHRRVELFAALGWYSAPFTVFREDQLGLVSSTTTESSRIEVPDWLIAYFDPGAESETPEGFLIVTRTTHASLGTQVELPWSLGLRATLFWRERPQEIRGWQPKPDDSGFSISFDLTVRSPHERAYGLELLLDRSLAPGVHGMLGYTLLRATTYENYRGVVFYADAPRVPANFDQRHNLLALVVFELPRGFRFGARFRLVSGNPERPVIGSVVEQREDEFGYSPIYGEFGSSYGPLFHQLDLRLDKTWTLRRLALIAYLDVQNVYNRVYPEIWVYSIDWTRRGPRIGLPIFPSLGVRAEF